MDRATDYNQVTESHLAKNYNNILYDCMMRCNVTGFTMVASPHYDNLLAYFGAVFMLYKNTFFLFYNNYMADDSGRRQNLARLLIDKMAIVKDDVIKMKREKACQTSGYFEQVMEKCDIIHMLTLDGLQRRHMLVRMGESEPKGAESVFYWKDKAAFRKGDLQAVRPTLMKG